MSSPFRAAILFSLKDVLTKEKECFDYFEMQVLFINIMAAQGHKRVCVIVKNSENTPHITQLCDICLIAMAAKRVLKKTRKNLFLQTITGYVLPFNTLLLQENYCCSLILQGGLMVQDLPLTW